jgi:hypothetical protein
MAISDDQKMFRARRLGSSDATRIMAGEWLEVWREKTGRIDLPCLDFVPAVQIGVATESLHARFYTFKTGIGCYPANEKTQIHPDYEFIVANLDFLTWSEPPDDPMEPADTLLEAKFHGGFKSDEELAEQYYWQLQHQMLVSGFGRAILSVLRPSGYSTMPIDRNEADIGILLETLRAFWWYVESDLEPADPLPVEAPDFEQMRVLDMSMHNRFVAVGGVLMDNQPQVTAYRQAEVELKALMPRDARVAFVPPEYGRSAGSSGLFVARSRDGRLSLRFGDVPRKYRHRAETWLPD